MQAAFSALNFSREPRRGATLLELLIYIAIFVIIIGSIVGILFRNP